MNEALLSQMIADGLKINALRTNNLLREDEWKQMDDIVIPTIKSELVGVADLLSRGMTKDLGGLGVPVTTWEAMSDMDGATVNMSGYTKPTNGDIEFKTFGAPVPMVMKAFPLNIRRVLAARKGGTTLELDGAAAAARVVAEQLESMLFNGTTVKVGGYSLYGYTNYPNRIPVNTSGAWDTTPANILPDVELALKTADTNNIKGPFILYIPQLWMSALRGDYNATAGKTYMERVMQNPEIAAIRVSTVLTANTAVLVRMNTDTVDLAVGQTPTTIVWDSPDGMMLNTLVFACLAPRIKEDFNGKCGVLHLT